MSNYYTLELFKNVDVQRNNENVRWFSTSQEQYAYFVSHLYRRIENNTPIKNKNQFLVEINVEEARIIPYACFYNSSNKKIYCFITDVQYLNESTTILSYEIDPIQTYMFEMKIGKSFVEREHVTNDTVGAHTIDEGLYTNELILNHRDVVSDMSSDMLYIINTTVSPKGEQVSIGGQYGGIIQGGKWFAYADSDSFKDAVTNINNAGKSDGIISIFMLPKDLIVYNTNTHEVANGLKFAPKQLTYSKISSLNGYRPKNKKLLCYPYNVVRIGNNGNDIKELKPERFGSNLSFKLFRNPVGTVNYAMLPNDYNGFSYDYRYMITSQPFPSCQWVNDPYADWLNANSTSNSIGVLTSMVSGATTGAIGGSIIPGIGTVGGALVGGVTSGLASAINSFSQASQKMSEPQSAIGSINANNILSVESLNRFSIDQLTVTKEIAQSIDDFFTCYGYKVNTFKVPNLTTHSLFNYVKLGECNITGNIPSVYLDKIISRFQNGITLWHSSFEAQRSKLYENEVVVNAVD